MDPTLSAPPVGGVLLKNVEIPRLPSPYYHFDYNSAGRVGRALFASGFTVYDVTYRRGRIKTVASNIAANHDSLEYEYDDAGRVEMVKYVTQSGLVHTLLFFTYDGQKLTGLERNRRIDSGGFVVDKTLAFSYYPDGNLLELSEHRPRLTRRQDVMTIVDRFEAYDNGINVDAFTLIHDEFFDHLLLLPDVQLQRGNPGRVTRTGDGAHCAVDYRYVYDDCNRPVAREGELTFLTGPQAGARFERDAQFSYY